MFKPQVNAFFEPTTFTYSYLVSNPLSNRCAIIDSVLDFDFASGTTNTASADLIIAMVEAQGLQVDWILETHVHADHLSAAQYLQAKLGGKIAIGAAIKTVQQVFGKAFNVGAEFAVDGSQFDQLFSNGDTFKIGVMDVKVMHTPGHTPACLTYVMGDAAFVGDTLFMPDYGTARCDFPGGDAATLYQSIQTIFSLPPKTRLFMCHDYLAPGRDEYCYETTVAEQQSNIHVGAGRSEADFVALRTQRDSTLAMPRLILPSVQVNMRAGQFPPAEVNGVSYLKIPLNQFK
ncbi:MAG TPA: MBL fold metallo-hydrolase [Marinospirillum sp.]|uniref:MBL fold metallo-hydrolase n=1 Tax=Marinospirillum sp. TaxID=2183934 RepID=UPI002B48E4A5|nr:MBL fold metallo-hydrolase [Marinospirillum sp.]HKM15847.1 MBL fold metallo-hydrolase [Marinospirillum sp.]